VAARETQAPAAPHAAGHGGGLRPVSGLLDLLTLESIEEDIFRGESRNVSSVRVFGGQVAAQALVAVGSTVPAGRLVHSLHAYFIRPGDPRLPIVYRADRTRDGRSFSTRRVVAVQRDEVIFSLSASFQDPEKGLEHQSPSALTRDVIIGGPETAARDGDEEWARRRLSFPIEVRWAAAPRGTADPRRYSWFRADGTLPDDPLIHVCALTYASDLGLLASALAPHELAERRGEVMMSSLDHALWFHRPFRADDWLFYANESPIAIGARALSRGEIYDPAGHLVASVMQEGLVRLMGPG
jgi:acyl-CoA thioesterase II